MTSFQPATRNTRTPTVANLEALKAKAQTGDLGLKDLVSGVLSNAAEATTYMEARMAVHEKSPTSPAAVAELRAISNFDLTQGAQQRFASISLTAGIGRTKARLALAQASSEGATLKAGLGIVAKLCGQDFMYELADRAAAASVSGMPSLLRGKQFVKVE